MPTPHEDYRTIELTQGQVALVDAIDYAWLMQYKWSAWWSKCNQSFYAISGTHPSYYMHRAILWLAKGDKRKGDHQHRDTLDNRRSNLRIATSQQNIRNSRKRTTNTSGYKGVHYRADAKKWRAEITVAGKSIHLGYHFTAEEAHAAYCEAANLHHREFARLS